MLHHARSSSIANASFHDLMKQLLRHMQISPSSKKEPEVYAFTFDGKTEIKMFSRLPGMFDVVVLSLGTLENGGSQAVLLNLLQLDYYTVDGPCLSVGIHPSNGKVCLWTRQSLVGMDLQKLVDLLHCALDRASTVRQHLEGKHLPAPTVPAGAKRRPLNLRLQS